MSEAEPKNLEPKYIRLWGEDLLVKADYAESPSHPKGSASHYITLVFSCHFCYLEISAYGIDRVNALTKAATEMRQMLASHQSLCDVCHANVIYKIVGLDGLEPGHEGDQE